MREIKNGGCIGKGTAFTNNITLSPSFFRGADGAQKAVGRPARGHCTAQAQSGKAYFGVKGAFRAQEWTYCTAQHMRCDGWYARQCVPEQERVMAAGVGLAAVSVVAHGGSELQRIGLDCSGLGWMAVDWICSAVWIYAS